MDEVSGKNVQAAGTAQSTVKQYKVGDVTNVELIGPGTLEIRRGAAGVLTLTASPADHEKLEIKANGDSLKVEFQGGMIRNRKPEGQLAYDLAVPMLEHLKISGGLSGQVINPESRKLELELKDGAVLTVTAMKVNDFEAKAGQASHLTVDGVVETQKVSLADGSTYIATALESESAEVDASDASQATIRTTHRLKVKASDGSNITYSGEKLDLDVKTSSGSTFRRSEG